MSARSVSSLDASHAENSVVNMMSSKHVQRAPYLLLYLYGNTVVFGNMEVLVVSSSDLTHHRHVTAL